MVCIFDPACELLPPWTKELYGTCVLLPLYFTFSLTSSPLFPFPMYSLYRQIVTCGGGGGGCWNVLWTISAKFLHYVLTRFKIYKVASPPQTKMTSKDDIKGLVSLKFLRPCPSLSFPGPVGRRVIKVYYMYTGLGGFTLFHYFRPWDRGAFSAFCSLYPPLLL